MPFEKMEIEQPNRERKPLDIMPIGVSHFIDLQKQYRLLSQNKESASESLPNKLRRAIKGEVLSQALLTGKIDEIGISEKFKNWQKKQSLVNEVVSDSIALIRDREEEDKNNDAGSGKRFIGSEFPYSTKVIMDLQAEYVKIKEETKQMGGMLSVESAEDEDFESELDKPNDFEEEPVGLSADLAHKDIVSLMIKNEALSQILLGVKPSEVFNGIREKYMKYSKDKEAIEETLSEIKSEIRKKISETKGLKKGAELIV